MTRKYALTCVGNAIVDVLAQADDAFLSQNAITKAAMNLIDQDRAISIFKQLKNPVVTSGGSAGNTAAGFASFGGKGAYLGKVAADQLGDLFRRDMQAQGIHFPTKPLENSVETARSMIIITPDAQRSMNTYLGACVEFTPDDVDVDTIENSDVIYLEGYLFDKPQAKAAYRHATKLARAGGTKVSLTLSDTFCVGRHRVDFLDLIKNDTDILFANEFEIKALFETDDLPTAIDAVRGICPLTAVTCSADGSVIVANDETIKIAAQPIPALVDTTGAGDQYAAGFLYGLVNGQPLKICGDLGSLAAAEVISHIGPRPMVSLANLAKERLKI